MKNNSPRRKLVAGEPLDGLSASMWNKLVKMEGMLKGGPLKHLKATGTVIDVKNSTGGALTTSFQVVEVAAPIITYSANADEFLRTHQLKGTTPATTSKTIAIVQESLSVDAIGSATLLGLTPVQVNVTDITHTFASPIASTANLTSGTSGPAKILWAETDETTRATGVQWCVVLLTNGAATSAGFIRFALPSALATTDASKASCTVDDYWGGTNPGSTATVYNLPASSDYMFSGLSGSKGLAVWDDIDSKYWIVQLECGRMSSIEINATEVNGGTTNSLIYTDGVVAQTADDTRIVSEKLEVKIASDRWIAFSKGSY